MLSGQSLPKIGCWRILRRMAVEPNNSTTMNVSLPEPLKQYVDGKVSSGIYGSASEFVREAIREKFLREQERLQAGDMLRSKLLEGLDSGKPIPFTGGHFKRKKRALSERIVRKSNRS
jgi:antitoxin ParD1/3/4